VSSCVTRNPLRPRLFSSLSILTTANLVSR
jgi:hypothetical protein